MDLLSSSQGFELRNLRAFVAVVDHAGFGSAGAALGLSQSAISLRVKALEEAVGQPLFDRAQRRVTLTAEGAALDAHARAILDLVAATGAALGGEVAGRLAVGAVPTVLASLLPPALARLRAAHPNLVLTVQSGGSAELAQRVSAREIDLAILTRPDIAPEGMRLHDIAEEQLAVMAPPGTPGRTPAALLAAHPFIFFNRKSWAGRDIERALAAAGLRVEARMEIDSLEAVVSMVAAGLGATVAPLRPGTALPEGVRVLPLEGPAARRRIAALEPAAEPRRRLTAPLIAALREAAREVPPGGGSGG